MRSGGYTIQQSLTQETASLLKQSLILAKIRCHAQITPLHVAVTLLTSKSNLFRRACLKSHPTFTNNYHFATSHHLELCLSVALNRLPTIPNPMFQFHPSLSNALIAALKRAQTHQRRGCIEQQQLLPVKIELELLVVSILDDPGVSRVMREAGFSSTAVKNTIEDSSVSTELYDSSPAVFSSLCSPSFKHQNPYKDSHQHISNPRNFWKTQLMNHSPEQNPLLVSPKKKVFTSNFCVKEDIDAVVEILQTRKKNPVIVSDSESLTEGIVSELIGKIERGEVAGNFNQICFIKFHFLPVALKIMKREDVETSMRNLKKKLCCITSSGRSVIIHMGDLKWTVDRNFNGSELDHEMFSSSCSSCYSPLDHLVEEIGNLVLEFNNEDFVNGSKVWVLGNASNETYLKCQMRKPSLETQWDLQAVSVPSQSLGLSLHASSAHEPMSTHQADRIKITAQDLIPKNCSYGFMGLVSDQTHKSVNSVAKFRRQKSSQIEFDSDNGVSKLESFDKRESNEAKITLDLCYSFSRGDSEKTDELRREETRQRKNNLIRVLQETVPWQSETLPFLVQTLIDSLSRKRDAWILISGNDRTGKQRFARAIAESVFGSAEFLVQINMMKSGFEEISCSEILIRSLRSYRKLVVLVEDVDLRDKQFMKLLADKFEESDSGEKDSQVIFVLTKDDSRNKKNRTQMSLRVKEHNPDQKRKSEWDSSRTTKKLKIEEKEEDAFSWQLGLKGSFDLNSEARENDEERNPDENSPVSSDLTREISSDSPISNGFLDFIKNRFVFDLNSRIDLCSI